MDTSKVPLGEPSGPFLNYCDPGEIAAFALAINDDNPLCRLIHRAVLLHCA